ncbi:hypothetical protein R1sor_020436 [Riccia sorocarpa]|uniref:Thaumatin-like protein n=1 Tax=Riccia sorocarpa TaxID=122646 RepID=A0ABD3IH21_9MARC
METMKTQLDFLTVCLILNNARRAGERWISSFTRSGEEILESPYKAKEWTGGGCGRSVTVKMLPVSRSKWRRLSLRSPPRLLVLLADCGSPPSFIGRIIRFRVILLIRIVPSSTGRAERADADWTTRSLQLLYLLILLLLPSGPQLSEARAFSVVNNCQFTIWPGMLSNAGQPSLVNGGFALAPGARQEITAPAGWAGRFWGRTGCNFDEMNLGSCETGDCGRGLYCDGAGGVPPATLAEFTLDGYASQDFYDVSLVDGYNVPLGIIQTGGSGVCGNPGCVSDLNLNCPVQLQVVVNGTVVSCKSACEAFQSDVYCCSGAYNSPTVCAPTEYSQAFKRACPSAYSYAYDDGSSTYTCTGAEYEIVFCPDGTSVGGDIPIPPPTPSTSLGPSLSPGVIAPPASPGSIITPPPPLISGTFPPPLSITPPVGSTFSPPPPAGNTIQFNQPNSAAVTRFRISQRHFLNKGGTQAPPRWSKIKKVTWTLR